MNDLLTQSELDRLLSFGSAETPSVHDDIVLQYCLWYGLNGSVWLAVAMGRPDAYPRACANGNTT